MNENNQYCHFISKSIDFCKGDCGVAEVSENLTKLIESLNGKDSESIISDILWFIDSMLTELFTDKIKENFVQVIRLCEKSIELNPVFLKDRLSDEILESLKLINSKQQYSARYVKTKTRVFYKQNKFNLIREANEGFSKLIVELAIFDCESCLMAEKIKSLIGYFDLDPNRVIDLILDVLELRLDKSVQFIELLQLLNADRQDITDLVGHKLVGNSNDSIYELIVTLINCDVIDLLGIYEHLYPSDDSMKEYYNNNIDNAKSKKFNNSIASKLKDDAISIIEEVEEIKAEDKDFSDNQKIRLCYHFLKLGNWKFVKDIMDIMPPYFPLQYPPLCKLLCKNLEGIIEPLYDRCCSLPAMLKCHRLTKFYIPTGSFERVCEYNQLNKLVFEITNYMGPMISTDYVLFSKLIRLTQSYFYEHKSKSKDLNFLIDETYQGFFNLIRNCLLPSLSMLNADVSLAEELWDAVKYLPYEVRYSLYIYWKDISFDDHPDLIEKKRSVQSQIRYILKRLSKENVKQLGRHLGKLCHCNPAIVFADVLNTVLMFSNLSVPVVDTVKYLGNLSLDILMFSIIETLAGNRVKMEDAQQSQWMQVMSTFVGLLCKRYQFDLVGLFQFILNMIKDGQCSDLIIIKEILHKMTGIEISEDITDDQMEAMSGGEILRQEAGYFIQIRNVRKNSVRLKEILIEHNMAIPYVIMLSQERNLLIHKSNDDHLKVLGRLYDQCHDTMLQMTSFISIHWSANEIVNNCPSLLELFNVYKVDPDVAFCLNRSNFNFKIQEKCSSIMNESIEIKNEEMDFFSTASQDIVDEFVQAVTPNYSQEIWDDFNSSFYTTFWLLQTSDLMVPEGAYKKQEIYLKSQIKLTEQDNTLSTLKKQKEIDRCNVLIEKLRDEIKHGELHVKLVDHWLNSVKGKWFVKNRSGAAKAIVMTRFIELCVFPRVCFSSNDALFVANLIYKLHRMKTPSFSTLICLDRIFNDITLMISTCSENEAKRYGRFLDAILTIIMKWHSSEDIFNEECVSHPGFVTVFRKNTDGNNKADQLTYENYRHVLHKWHYRVTKSIVSCLESENYVQIRNSLIILEKILTNYPKVQQFGQAIERRIELLKEKEKDKRPDLHILTQSYFGHMVAKKLLWLQDKDFHQKDEAKKAVVKHVPNGERNGLNNSSEVNPSIVKSDGSTTRRANDIDDKETFESKRRKMDPNINEKKSLSSEKSQTSKAILTSRPSELKGTREISKSGDEVSKLEKSPLMPSLKNQQVLTRNTAAKK